MGRNARLDAYFRRNDGKGSPKIGQDCVAMSMAQERTFVPEGEGCRTYPARATGRATYGRC